MRAVIQVLAKQAAVDAAIRIAKTNASKLMHVASDTEVQHATVELAKAISSSWREAGPATAAAA